MSPLHSLILAAALAGMGAAAAPPLPPSAIEAMLRDGLNEPAWKGVEALVSGSTNTAERAQAALLGARAALGRGTWQDGLDLLARCRAEIGTAGLGSPALFWEARLLLARGLPAEASRLLAGVDALDSADPYRVPLLRLKARCLVALDKPDDALAFLAMAATSPARGPAIAEAILDQAVLLVRSGREAEAAPLFAELSTSGWSTPASAEARVWLGRILAARQEYAAGRREVEPVATSTNTLARVRAQAYEVLASIHEGEGDLPRAVRAAENMEIFLTNPSDAAKARVERARLLILSGQLEAGSELLRANVAAAGLPEGASQTQSLIAVAHAASGRHEEALRAWQEYLEAFDDPAGLALAHFNRGCSLSALGRHAEAAQAFARVSDQGAGEMRTQARMSQAEALMLSQSHAAAREIHLELAVTLPDGDPRRRARFQAAVCLARMGSVREAVAEFDAIAAGDPGGPHAVPALRQAAILLEQLGEWDAAIAGWKKILGLATPGAGDAGTRLGLLLYRKGDYAAALAEFRRLSAAGGAPAEQATFLEAWTLHMMGRSEEALRMAAQFIQEQPRSEWADDALYWIGEVRFNRGDYPGAEAVFARLLKEFPDGESAANALFWAGRAAAAQKQFVRATEYFSRFVDRHPASPIAPEALFHEADAQAALGRFPAAILVFEEIIKRHPRSPLVPAAWGRKGDCSFALGADDPDRYPEAARAFRFLLESGDTPVELRWQAEYKLAQTLSRQGDAESALQHWLSVVYGVPSDGARLEPSVALWFARAALDAGSLLEARNRSPEAVAVYRRLAATGLAAAEEANARIRRLQSPIPQKRPGS